MARRLQRRSTAPTEERVARWELCQLAAFAHWAVVGDEHGPIYPERRDSPTQAALRELMTAHQAAPLSPLEACAEALQLLDDLDGAEVFAEWRLRVGGAAGHWPTNVRRLRAV